MSPSFLPALFILCFPFFGFSQPYPRFVETDSLPVPVPKEQSFKFGYLEVLENRQVPDGPIVRLPVYIFKSRNPEPKPNPVLLTLGGPGVSSLSAAPYMQYYAYLEDRDLILFEQRGNQYAQPHLDCPEWGKSAELSLDPRYSPEETLAEKIRSVSICKERLEAKGIDLNAYRTRVIARDIEDLRRVLNIEKWNLLTLSYSTKIAQVLMRDYPATIRSAVMDSALPLEVNYDRESLVNKIEAFEKLFRDCARDSACRAAFPGLKEEFYQLLQWNKADIPEGLTVLDPKIGQEINVPLSGRYILPWLNLSSTYEIPKVPARIHDIYNGNFQYLKKSLEALWESGGSGNGKGMRLSVWCAEELPFAVKAGPDKRAIREEANIGPGLNSFVFEPEICEAWGVDAEPPSENQAVKSDIPVLLINGEYDPDTPPRWAAAMLPNLPNGHHLVFKGFGHTPIFYWNNPCAMQAANAFFNDPGQQPSLDCLQQVRRPSFSINE